ncbi:MAG: hypothetical protein ACI4UE_04420 [Candidatus Scatovivens sp.]
MEKIIKDDLLDKLNYLGLDLNNIPECFNYYEPINFNISRLNNDKDHKVFKYVPIDKIEILLTPTLRSDSIKSKYSNASPLITYLEPYSKNEEENIEKYSTFLRMLSTISIPDIENISNLQKEMEDKEPFRVKYNKDHLWQIYYSEATDKYFMLVSTEEQTYSECFYLIKKKIELYNSNSKKSHKIFVPINYLNYSEELLNRNEIIDVENYLWLFTKNWPLIFEVYDNKNNLSLQIIGDTYVFDNVKSTYKIKLENSEEAIKFYKLLKACFILQTEIKDAFKFTTKIDSKNNLELYYGQIKLDYSVLPDFIKTQYMIAEEEIKAQTKSCNEEEKKLKDLNNKVKKKEKEYLEKQKEISTYLEYRKTFFGKVKYYFKSTKSKKNSAKLEENTEENNIEEKNSDVLKPMQLYTSEKDYYSLEDLITIYSIYEKGEKYCKDLELDLKAMENKLANYEAKVKNATLYISEIDKHKKSIFDFWKFANKDEQLALDVGIDNTNNTPSSQIRKSFDYNSDFEQMGIDMDKIQRTKLSKDEQDSIFVAKSNILFLLNMLRDNKMDKDILETNLMNLQNDFNKSRLFIDLDSFDVFGNIEEDSRKIKYIGNKSHRENEKNVFKLLNINKKIDVFDFTERLQYILNNLESSIKKIKANFDFPIYKLVQISENIKESCFDIFNLNIENELKNFEDRGEGALNLIKINFEENLPLLFYTNTILYDNNNNTLPEGMDLSTEVLLDCSKFNFELVKKYKFRTNNYFRESNNLILPKYKDIFVYEYNINLKK